MIKLIEKKNKKNKNNKKNNYNASKQNFITSLEEIIDIEYRDKTFWSKLADEFIDIVKNEKKPKNIKNLKYVYDVITGEIKINDIQNYTEANNMAEKIISWYEDNHYVIPQYESDQEITGDLKILMEFLKMPLNRTAEVFKKFGGSDGNYYYIEGSLPKEKRVLLIAHADTVWDGDDSKYEYANPYTRDGIIYPSNPYSGLGADDRAGIAMLWLLKDMGHSILITNYEEVGRVGAQALVNGNKELHKHLQDNHNFFIQLDRQGATDYKCYYVASSEFRKFLNQNTFFSEPNRSSFTDICTLCETVCGVNLSVGYYDEHRVNERLNIKEWQRVLDFLRTFLAGDLPRFDLKPEKNIYRGGYTGYDYTEYNYPNEQTTRRWEDDWDDDWDDDWEDVDLDDLDYDITQDKMQGLNDDLPPEKTPNTSDKTIKKIQKFLDRVPKGKSKNQEFENGKWIACARRYTPIEYQELLIDGLDDEDIIDEFVLDAYHEIGFDEYIHYDRGIWGEHTVFGLFYKKPEPKNKKKDNKSKKINKGRISRIPNTNINSSAQVDDDWDHSIVKLP